MRILFTILVSVILVFSFSDTAQARSYVKVAGVLQDHKSITPLSDIADTLSYSVALETRIEKEITAGLLFQRLNAEDYLTFATLEYTPPINLGVQPYMGVGLGRNLKTFEDGFIITGNGGLKFNVFRNIGVYTEIRTLTWFDANRNSEISLAAGLSIIF